MYATLHLDDDFVRDAGKWFLKGVPRVTERGREPSEPSEPSA